MDLFEEIAQTKEDFPKVSVKSISKNVQKQKLNFYQIFAIGFFVLLFFMGIVLGNLFSTCENVFLYGSDVCLGSKFNFSLMLCIWLLGILVSIVFYAIGHIISLLSDINQKLGKK